MNIDQIRLANIERILSMYCNGKKINLSKKLNVKQTNLSKWWSNKDRRNISTRSARKIEVAFKLENGWMDSEHPEYELEPNHNKKTQQQVAAKASFAIPLTKHCTIDTSLSLTELSLKSKGVLMLLSTDSQAYGLQFIGHHSNPILSEGWGVVVEPNTPLTENEYALIQLNNGELLLRIISYQDNNIIIITNPMDSQQRTLQQHEINSAYYCYIAIPPSKILKEQ